MDVSLIVLLVGIGLWVIMFVAIIVLAHIRRVYLFAIHSHDVRVEIKGKGAFLYVDGTLADQVSGQNMRLATLHTLIDHEEFRAHINVSSFFRVKIQATLGGRDVPLAGMGK